MSTTSITASVLHGAKDLRLETRPLPSPQASELQISVRATGLCGSDLHYYHHGRNGDILVREPLSLGHESAGVVEAVGEDVRGFKVGDCVALEVGIPAGTAVCAAKDVTTNGSITQHGGAIENVSLDEGALLEPMSVAIHATRRAALEAGSTVLVLGAGAVGMLTAAMLKVHGARTIIIADIEPTRVDFALKHGFADRGFIMPRKRAETIDEKLNIAKTAADAVGKTFDVDGKEIEEFDAVFECTGVEICLQTAVYATKPTGKVLLIGMGTPIQTLHISAAALREVDLLGVFRYCSTYEDGITLLANKNQGIDGGRPCPDLTTLITHRVKGIDNIQKAFEIAAKPTDDEGNLVMKVFIEID